MLKFEKVDVYVKENNLDEEIVEQVVIQVKYFGYIEKEKNNVDKLNCLEEVKILENFDYYKIKFMFIEVK